VNIGKWQEEVPKFKQEAELQVKQKAKAEDKP